MKVFNDENNYKPDKSHVQSFLKRQENPEPKSSPEPAQKDTPLVIPERDIWEQRALWILIGIFITIVVLWLANLPTNSGVPDDCYYAPSKAGTIECN